MRVAIFEGDGSRPLMPSPSIASRAANSAVRVPSSHGGSRRFESAPPNHKAKKNERLTKRLLKLQLRFIKVCNSMTNSSDQPPKPTEKPTLKSDGEAQELERLAIQALVVLLLEDRARGGMTAYAWGIACSNHNLKWGGIKWVQIFTLLQKSGLTEADRSNEDLFRCLELLHDHWHRFSHNPGGTKDPVVEKLRSTLLGNVDSGYTTLQQLMSDLSKLG